MGRTRLHLVPCCPEERPLRIVSNLSHRRVEFGPGDHRSAQGPQELQERYVGALHWLVMGTHQKAVESQFKQTWRHTTACPEVRAVYKIIVTEASLRQYQQYLYERFSALSDFAVGY